MDYQNANGLVGGNIPTGKPCPFLAKCADRVPTCPSTDNPKRVMFSCAAARLFSMCVLTWDKEEA